MRDRRLGSRSLTVPASFKEGKTARRGASVRPSLDADEFINLLHGSDPMKMDLNRLENEVRGLSNRNIGTIANDIVQVPITVGGAMLMDKSGRRPLLMANSCPATN
nr:microtubule-associated protein 70-2-like [Ipomoea batatas]GMD48456.1 microtubule-associated protein 70-2-like [Ipomoea batatas]GMD93631.1 microtubule-associated protein 70-2-like [Ipomoea batatas]